MPLKSKNLQVPILTSSYEEFGFVVLDDLVDAQTLESLRDEADHLLVESSERGGARNALRKSQTFRGLAESGAPFLVARAVLGSHARPTKLTIFDKTSAANWKVPWHQDRTVAVKERRDVPGFGPWTVKDGQLHVQAPREVLAQVLALRLHLDDTPAENGALRVIPGSHVGGVLSDEPVARARDGIQAVVCPVRAGGAMLMSPLLLHASSPATAPGRRRVLHFEYSAAQLPGGLEWA